MPLFLLSTSVFCEKISGNIEIEKRGKLRSKAIITQNVDRFIFMNANTCASANANANTGTNACTDTDTTLSVDIDMIDPHGASGVIQYLVYSNSYGVVEGALNSHSNSNSNSNEGDYLDFSPHLWMGLPSTIDESANLNQFHNPSKVVSPYSGDENSLIGSMLVVVIATVIPICIWYFKWIH